MVEACRRVTGPREGVVSASEAGGSPAGGEGGPDGGSDGDAEGRATSKDGGGSEAYPKLVVPQFLVAVALETARDAGGGKVPHALLLESPGLLLAAPDPARGTGPTVQGGRCRGRERKVHVHCGNGARARGTGVAESR